MTTPQRYTWFRIVAWHLMPVFIMSVIAGACGLLALTYRHAYDSMQTQTFTNARLQVSAGAYAFTYGTVTSIDGANRILTIARINIFAPDGPPLTMRATVPDDATVVRQELSGEGGIMTTLVSDTSASFADIRPGDRVAVTLAWKTNWQLPAATVVLFGNPL